MVRRKRKGATANLADSDKNNNQDQLPSTKDDAHHNGLTMKLKEGKNNDLACGTDVNSNHIGKDMKKGNIPKEIVSKKQYKNTKNAKKKLERSRSPVEKNVVHEEDSDNQRNSNKKGTNKTRKRVSNEKGKRKEAREDEDERKEMDDEDRDEERNVNGDEGKVQSVNGEGNEEETYEIQEGGERDEGRKNQEEVKNSEVLDVNTTKESGQETMQAEGSFVYREGVQVQRFFEGKEAENFDEYTSDNEVQSNNRREDFSVLTQYSSEREDQDNETVLLPYEPLDTDLLDSATMNRIKEVNIDELEGERHLFLNLNRVYIDVQLLRLITPNSTQKAVIYGARRRTTNQEVIFSRLMLCRIHSEENYMLGSKLIYLMESKNSNKCMFDKNVELRDNGVISIGTFFRIISPHPIENKMRGDIPLLKTDIPLIVMTRPNLSIPIPVYKELGEHSSLAFVLTGMTININRSSPIQTTCGGLLCDKQRCEDWNGTRGCGCYHMSPDISSIVFQHSVFFSVGNDRIYHSNFSSTKFSSFYLSRRLPGSTPVSALRATKDFWDIEDCISKVVDLVNTNGGWTVIGWYKRGVITDKSLLEVPLSNVVSTQVAAGQINYHIVQMLPTNNNFFVRDTALFEQLQQEKYNVSNLTQHSA